MPEELWTEVHDIVQEAVIKTIPKKKNCKKAKWLSEEALQIPEKRRKAKNKREKERYTHLNAEFQRIARRDKKAFLNNQYKEIKKNNRMGKTRDLNKGTFHAKMGTIKDRNGMDLIQAEDIKKRWQEYTEELYEKDLNDPDNHGGMTTHVEPDTLECKVKWVISSVQFSSITQSCPNLCNTMNHSKPGLPVHHQFPEFTQTHVHRVVMSSSHLILCRPLLLLPLIPPSIRVFSKESTLHMR